MTYPKTIRYYKTEEGNERISCLLCQHSCKLKEELAYIYFGSVRVNGDTHCPKCDSTIDGLW